jgi:5'-deoxynucleotidase YfbR-like HD superfamily hydrolase
MSTESAISTYSGLALDVLVPRREDVRLVDIVHALANLCRFAGHVRTFWSVAAHSMFVADLVRMQTGGSAELELYALLHESSEAYLIDLPRPLKYHSAIGAAYREVEARLMTVLAQAFGLADRFEHHPAVKDADEVAAIIEGLHLLPRPQWALAAARERGLEQLAAAQAHRFQRDATPAFTRARFEQRILEAARAAGVVLESAE